MPENKDYERLNESLNIKINTIKNSKNDTSSLAKSLIESTTLNFMKDKEDADICEDIIEIILLSRLIGEDEAKTYIQENIFHYPKILKRQKEKKTFKSFISELKGINESFVNKAAITSLFAKFRNSLKNTKDEKKRFKILADMIVLSTLFTNETLKELLKKLSKEQTK